MSFEDRLEKGSIGERIVDEWLIRRGYVPYRPMEGVAHPFDRLVASRDKKRIAVCEVKTKPRRNKYRDTGVDIKKLNDYTNIQEQHRLRVFIAFVDEVEAQVYGNTLDELMKTRTSEGQVYPKEYDGIRYFPLDAMIVIADLTDEQCTELKKRRRSEHDGFWNDPNRKTEYKPAFKIVRGLGEKP